MANVFSDDYSKKPVNSGVRQSGSCEVYPWKKAATNGDKIYFGIIPAGTLVTDVDIVHDAVASATLSLGFEPVDGANPAANLTQWLSAQSLASAGRKQSASKPIRFDDDVKLVGTLGGANLSGSNEIHAIIKGQGVGIGK